MMFPAVVERTSRRMVQRQKKSSGDHTGAPVSIRPNDTSRLGFAVTAFFDGCFRSFHSGALFVDDLTTTSGRATSAFHDGRAATTVTADDRTGGVAGRHHGSATSRTVAAIAGRRSNAVHQTTHRAAWAAAVRSGRAGITASRGGSDRRTTCGRCTRAATRRITE